MLNFDFPEKGLSLVSPPNFVYDFSGKMLYSCYMLLIDQITLSLLLEIWGNMRIAIVN